MSAVWGRRPSGLQQLLMDFVADDEGALLPPLPPLTREHLRAAGLAAHARAPAFGLKGFWTQMRYEQWVRAIPPALGPGPAAGLGPAPAPAPALAPALAAAARPPATRRPLGGAPPAPPQTPASVSEMKLKKILSPRSSRHKINDEDDYTSGYSHRKRKDLQKKRRTVSFVKLPISLYHRTSVSRPSSTSADEFSDQAPGSRAKAENDMRMLNTIRRNSVCCSASWLRNKIHAPKRSVSKEETKDSEVKEENIPESRASKASVTIQEETKETPVLKNESKETTEHEDESNETATIKEESKETEVKGVHETKVVNEKNSHKKFVKILLQK